VRAHKNLSSPRQSCRCSSGPGRFFGAIFFEGVPMLTKPIIFSCMSSRNRACIIGSLALLPLNIIAPKPSMWAASMSPWLIEAIAGFYCVAGDRDGPQESSLGALEATLDGLRLKTWKKQFRWRLEMANSAPAPVLTRSRIRCSSRRNSSGARSVLTSIPKDFFSSEHWQRGSIAVVSWPKLSEAFVLG
jgi:hypothetical protein